MTTSIGARTSGPQPADLRSGGWHEGRRTWTSAACGPEVRAPHVECYICKGREMRPGKIDRVKRQLLAEAVADNFDTIRGLPPRSLRRARRAARRWIRGAP